MGAGIAGDVLIRQLSPLCSLGPQGLGCCEACAGTSEVSGYPTHRREIAFFAPTRAVFVPVRSGELGLSALSGSMGAAGAARFPGVVNAAKA
jgi:hypothetical protein